VLPDYHGTHGALGDRGELGRRKRGGNLHDPNRRTLTSSQNKIAKKEKKRKKKKSTKCKRTKKGKVVFCSSISRSDFRALSDGFEPLQASDASGRTLSTAPL
jgi:hypothetical protein